MNAAQIHLLTNHLPILGAAFALLVLAMAFLMRANPQPVRNAAYAILIVSALGAVVANWSGEGAEEIAEHIAGVTHDAIEEHEDAAVFALWSSLLSGFLAAGALVAGVLRPTWNGRMALVVGLVTLWAFTVAARTGWLGGKIRHTELEQVK